MKYEILKDSPDLREHIINSPLKEFIYVNDPNVDLDYFEHHAKLGSVGMHFGKGPFILNGDGSIEMIISSDYEDGYELKGPFYLEKNLLLNFLESGSLPLNQISGLPVIYPPKGEKRPTLFLDRDGVINEDKRYVGRIDQLTFFDDLLPIIKYANEKNWFVIVLTNQSGIGRGLFTSEDVEKLHAYMSEELEKKGAKIDDWFYSPFHREGGIGEYKKFSFTRKPYPGMALKACEKYPVDLDKSFMIGDKLTDDLYLPGLRPIHITRGSDLSAAQAPVYKTFEEILKYIKSLT